MRRCPAVPRRSLALPLRRAKGCRLRPPRLRPRFRVRLPKRLPKRLPRSADCSSLLPRFARLGPRPRRRVPELRLTERPDRRRRLRIRRARSPLPRARAPPAPDPPWSWKRPSSPAKGRERGLLVPCRKPGRPRGPSVPCSRCHWRLLRERFRRRPPAEARSPRLRTCGPPRPLVLRVQIRRPP